jgi:hypothetical protein
VDYIFVDLEVFGTLVLVAVVYCPPRIVIMGDLNVDLLKTTVSSHELVDGR